MENNLREQAFALYSEMHDSQMALFNAGWELCQRGKHEEGIVLMRQGNQYNNTETYLLIIGLGDCCRKDYWLPERAESLPGIEAMVTYDEDGIYQHAHGPECCCNYCDPWFED